MCSEEKNQLDSKTLRSIVEGTSTETGEEFFETLVERLAFALQTKCAWVTEWFEEEDRLSAMAMWVDDRHVPEYSYQVSGTPCERVIKNRKLVHFPDRVIELYPDDPDLEPLGAVSYLGVPLLDTDQKVLGHLAVLHDEPLAEDSTKLDVFRIFAGRAAAELRRLRRDRHVREREEKLSSLFDSAMDAIVEMDGELLISRVNSAAEKAFGCSAKTLTSSSLASFLSKEAGAKVARLMEELTHQPMGFQSLWILEGLDAVNCAGEEFPAEATLSRFEVNGQSYFALILRNVNERQEAEARIVSLTNEAAYLRNELEALQGFEEIIGESKALRRVLADLESVAKTETTVLITGETGTGKELIARAIHRRSQRPEKPLIKVNCAAIPATLQESEFFGHEKGAFTGATQRREGRFKLADGGTIFLDEVGELPLELQAKLLRVLQEGEYEPVGSSRTQSVNVRVIAATNRDLEAMVKTGSFRKDLLYRLNVFPLNVPPLRERENDVVMLASFFASNFASQAGNMPPRLTKGDESKLQRYDWPGNIRELQNVVERAFITAVDGRLNLARALPEGAENPRAGHESARREPPEVLTALEVQELERENLLRALHATQWKISGKKGAAELLGLNANTLSSRMKSLGIQRPSSSS